MTPDQPNGTASSNSGDGTSPGNGSQVPDANADLQRVTPWTPTPNEAQRSVPAATQSSISSGQASPLHSPDDEPRSEDGSMNQPVSDQPAEMPAPSSVSPEQVPSAGPGPAPNSDFSASPSQPSGPAPVGDGSSSGDAPQSSPAVAGATTNTGPKTSKGMMIALLVVAVVLAALGGYLLFR